MSGKILRGVITADATPISSEVSQCQINLKRNGVSVAATFGEDGYTDQGDLMKECVFTYRTHKAGAAGSVSGAIFWEAILAGENVEITAVFAPGPVSATNPEYQFTIVPLETSRGGTVGSVPTASVTYSIVGDIVEDTGT